MIDDQTVSFRVSLDCHANGLALNKDSTQIAVAGRSLLKIYSIDSDKFNEVHNLRSNKVHNLSYSSNDVAWSPLDNNILATAATNGVVSVWDLSKFGRQKQHKTYSEHERTAHTVTFHCTEPFLLSGSQDGTIKKFDLKNEKPVTTYFSNSESVRDVKFNPNSPNTFAAVSENGTVQLWDIRRSDKCILQFSAHSGPIYTCDWHATQPWLATGSRDKQIKVWNMGQSMKPTLEYTIHTIAVVGRVKWRPEMTYHIASCSLVVDYSIHIWDVRRPYIPFASFNEHSNITTGISWKGNDPNTLLSTSKDSTIYQHAFKNATKPSSKANPQGASINFKGELLFSYKVKINNTPLPTNSRTSFIKSKPASMVDQFYLAKSNLQNLYQPSIPALTKDSDRPNLFKDYIYIQGCAKEYILSGKTISELCDHNSNVAKKYGKSDVSLIWNFVKKMYSTPRRMTSNIDQRSLTVGQNSLSKRLSQTSNQLNSNWDDKKGKTEENILLSGTFMDNLKQSDIKHPKSGEFKHHHNGSLGNIFTSDSNEFYSDNIFSDMELTVNCVKSLRNGFLYTGPHDICKGLSIPNSTMISHELQPSQTHEYRISENSQDIQTPVEPPSTLKIILQPSISQWESHQVLTDCLMLQTDIGDVQTSVSVLIVLGDKRNDLSIDNNVYESWLMSYIDLLHHYKLWNPAVEIMKHSWIRSVREINEQSTAVHTNCGNCSRNLLGPVGWYCTKCKSADTSKCSVCNLVVRGLYAWCQGCSHGGHLEHMKQWFLNNSKCPKCGHLCEYD